MRPSRMKRTNRNDSYAEVLPPFSPVNFFHDSAISRRSWLTRPWLTRNLRAASLVRWPRLRNSAMRRLRRFSR